MKTVRILGFLTVLMLMHSSMLLAQQSKDEKAIHQTLKTMFDGMRAGDSTMVSSVFLPDAEMGSIGANRNGEVMYEKGSLNRFLSAVGTPHTEMWDERIAGVKIIIDADLAHVWVPYSFYRGDTFSHCGVNSFQFVKIDGKWKVANIIDTRRGDACVEDL